MASGGSFGSFVAVLFNFGGGNFGSFVVVLFQLLLEVVLVVSLLCC